jgi:phage FluMu protein Com
MEAAHAAYRPLAVLESVRCLECGEVYAKPSAGGTVEKNPGCPVCGYVGWIPLTLPDEGGGPRHSGEGPHLRRFAKAR